MGGGRGRMGGRGRRRELLLQQQQQLKKRWWYRVPSQFGPPDWAAEQERWRAEGAPMCEACGEFGHDREDCPYEDPQYEEAWNQGLVGDAAEFWVRDQAQPTPKRERKRGESVRPAPKRGESVRPAPKRGESVRPAPKRGESVRPAPKRGESVRPAPKRGESVRPAPKRGESVRPAPKRGESVRPAPKRGESVRPQPKKGKAEGPQPSCLFASLFLTVCYVLTEGSASLYKMDTAEEADICRVCRSEGTPDKPLYHPCVCTGSIKFIHQECLVQWLKHSRKEYCELCKHRFAFTPNMPSRLPIQDIFAGLVTSIGTAIRYWFHYTLVAFAWLGVVPLTAYCLQGCFVVTCTLCAFISLVWLREQIVHGGAPQWLDQNQQQPANGAGLPNEAPGAGNGAAENVPAPAPPNPPAENAVVAEIPEIQADPAEDMEADNDDEDDPAAEDAADANNGAQAFCPYHIGHFSVVGLGFEEYVQASHFEGLITTIVGYVLLAVTLIVCHIEQGLAAVVKFQRSRRLLGVCYIVVKVSLLVVVEIGVFPLICGWWLDICSLEMFDASLKDRELSFQSAPGTTMFLHWLVGMVYVFYFASFILLLREVVFGSIVLLMLWLPIRIIKQILPDFLPYNVMLYSDAPVSELSLELLLLQVVLPALLEQGHTRQWLKGLVRAWTVTAGYLLDLHSYLLGDQEENDNNANQQANNNQQARNNNAIPVVGEGLHAAHQAILQQGGPVGFQPYHRPMRFPFRIVLLIGFMCATLLVASLICLTLPVFTGRWLMSFWTGSAKIHELYTAACGLYVCWLSIRAITVLLAWMPQGRRVIALKVQEWSLMLSAGILLVLQIVKTLIVAVLLAGVVPLLLGLLFELVIVAPLRVPLDQTPLFYPWQVYANGIRNIDLHFIIQKLAAPVIAVLLLSLCVPYVIAVGIVPVIGVADEMQNLVQRRIYPFLLMVVMLIGILSFQIRQFKRLYEHIKNDKYLVGQRLVNYERKTGKVSSTPPTISPPD
ncbi:UNVERIFIED_CONTAM: hypothetical protein FKN15_030513 [Acipenser sinensis]